MSWIVIPGWDKFQHYRDRRPAWIKDYPELLDRDEYLELTPTARALLQDLRRLYALRDGVVARAGARARLRLPLRREHWEELIHAGFIEIVASKPLALHARAKEREKEKEPPMSPNHKPRARVTGWRLVRGSHGQTHIPDPNGTDRPPPEVRT